VPVTALRHGNEGDFVYVLRADRTVSMRKVTAGQSAAERVAITSGLAVGEPVITEGGDRLKEGARVQLPGERAASGAASGAHAGASWAGGGASRPHRQRAASAASS
jgi:multidrug efflux system membrane fusion protein